MRKVDIGSQNARDHMNGHVATCYSRFLATKTRDNALEVMKAILDLTDWDFRDTYPGVDTRSPEHTAFVEVLIAACPELEWIRDGAEATKHGGQLSRASVKVRAIVGTGSQGMLYGEFGPMGPPPCTLAFELVDGTQHSVPDALQKVMKFWRQRLP